jgi:hypothetical protein
MNNKDQNLSKLVNDLSKLKSDDIFSFNGLELILSTTNSPDLVKSTFTSFKEVEILPENKISIKLTSSKYDKVIFFLDEMDFIKRSRINLNNYEEYDIIFIMPKGKPGDKDVTVDRTNLFCKNYLIYRETLNFFLDTKEFAQFKNESTKNFTIISKEYGVFHIGFRLPDFYYFYSINLEGKLRRLKDEFAKKEFIQFFKEIVVASIHSTTEGDRFQTLISQLDSIIDLTSKDYEAYVSNFAIDKIKSEFKEERESYFENIDRGISAIGKQVVSFPLTFAASIFASYKVQDKPGVILLILFAYFLYTLIAILILRMTSYNVRCLRQDVTAEETQIKTEFRKLFSNFESDFKKIKNKILNLRIIIGVLYGVLISLFILFALYSFNIMTWIDLTDLEAIFKNIYRGKNVGS